MTRATPAIALALVTALGLSACSSTDNMSREERTAAGAVIGGVAGAAAGAQIAGNNNRTAGAIIGGVIGAGTGAAVGNSVQ